MTSRMLPPPRRLNDHDGDHQDDFLSAAEEMKRDADTLGRTTRSSTRPKDCRSRCSTRTARVGQSGACRLPRNWRLEHPVDRGAFGRKSGLGVSLDPERLYLTGTHLGDVNHRRADLP